MKSVIHLSLAFVAATAVAACGGASHTETAPPPADVATRFATAERIAVPTRVDLAGNVAALRSAAVSSRVMATVTAVHVDLGDHVRRGQLLVSIDPTAAEGQLGQAEGALAQARSALVLAQRNFERFQALAASDSASELELDMARMQLDQAKGAVRQAEGAVAAAGSVAGESKVVAPFDGRVTGRPAEVGDLAAPGRPLVLLDSDQGRRLVVSVPEALAASAALAPGAAVPVTLDAAPERGEIAGTVAEVSPGPDPMTHAYTVTIELPDASVPAGAAGRAWIAATTDERVLVPEAAVIASGGLDLVVVRGDEGRAETRVVTLGRRQGEGRIEVLSGLAGGETVAVGLASAPAAGARLVESSS